MDPENLPGSNLKASILADSHLFLTSLQAGASEEQLNIILARIKQEELQLMAEHGLKLSPEVWNILQNRLVNRKPKDIIDIFENGPIEQR